MTTTGDSGASKASDDQPCFNVQFPPALDEILSKVANLEILKSLDSTEKQFALAALILSKDPATKAWAADLLHENKITSFSFIDANNARREVEIEVIPHGLGKRMYVNINATDNFGRKRNYLRALKYEDGTYRRSAYAHYYCPIWMKLVGNTSYLSGNILNFAPEYRITSEELEFDIDNLEIANTSDPTESTDVILGNLLEPFFQIKSSTELAPFKWNLTESIIDAINEMDVRDRDAYFEGKLHATKSSAELSDLKSDEKSKYEFYKHVYSSLMLDAASANIPMEQMLLSYEICIRSGIDSIPHKVFKLLCEKESEPNFDKVISYLVNIDPVDIEYAQNQRFGPALRVHLQKVLQCFLDEVQSDTLLETFDSQIGLKNVSKWIIIDRMDDMRYKLKQDLKALVAIKAKSGDYVELLSSALADPYFQHYLNANPLEMQKITKILIAGMGEADYKFFVKPLLES